jgi:hypothetical protein
MIIQGQVGAPSNQASIAPGANPTIRLGQLGDVVVSELHGRYYETTYRQSMFSTFINALTLASTHATPLSAGTGTPIIGIYNPIGSGKNMSIVRVQQATTSGTPGGPLVWNIVPNPQNITASTNATAYNMATLQQTGSVTRMWNNTAVTGSTAGVAFRNAGGPTTTAVTGAIFSYVEEYAGSFIVPPGSMISLCCTAAGTSHVINCYLEWEEIPI